MTSPPSILPRSSRRPRHEVRIPEQTQHQAISRVRDIDHLRSFLVFDPHAPRWTQGRSQHRIPRRGERRLEAWIRSAQLCELGADRGERMKMRPDGMTGRTLALLDDGAG